jgi:glutamyl-tRNA synthetase
VRSRLAASLRLAAPGEAVSMADLLTRFDPSALPTEPWIATSVKG